jgi:GNAT superfamily N-acetyltransferase
MHSAAAQAACRTRVAQDADLRDVLALYHELRPHDPEIPLDVARKAFAGILERDDVQIVVCDAGGARVATCMLAIIPNLAAGARPFGIIEHVVTLAAHRGRGYGRRVLDHALALAWERRCYKVTLLSGAQRPQAHRLYQSAGFDGDAERGFVIKAPDYAAR